MSDTDGPRYEFAEPEPGCTFFVPRRGDATRSRAVLAVAKAWFESGPTEIPEGPDAKGDE
jgi:hypothetical protein